ncbi:TlyA family RNA methyltransferase [Ornithinicoccus halotolerans]|uniref:TlyA family RNA methyltransferase n=1 Tax=Ornithinicoccus halotolerans TaxID=1748220 RepID=UPI001295D361|nr:TlyA family RNA methyltransferase [Ornithinicoccus halotolerans]
MSGPQPVGAGAAPSRLDKYLVDSGQARSRGEAAALVREGRVRVGGRLARRPALPVLPGRDVIDVEDHPRWVGRGAGKLHHALSHWAPPVGEQPAPGPTRALRVAGRRCLDVGASTGGFSQVLLAHGASHVTALDVGHGQLAPEVRADPRVREISGRNIRDVAPGQLGEPFEVVVADLSFISLRTVLPQLRGQLADDGDLVLLVKPQFEAGRAAVRRGQGVVRDAESRSRALLSVVESATGLGLGVRGVERSPHTGARGNVEYLLWLTAPGPGMMTPQALAARADQLGREE